jgi:NADH-quinone oxidoreductase subunit L
MYKQPLLLPILTPLAGALIALLLPRRITGWLTVAVCAANAFFSSRPLGAGQAYSLPWLSGALSFSLRGNNFNCLLLFFAALLAFLLAVYSAVFLRDRPANRLFYFSFLLALAFSAGVFLADNLLLLLFCWEGILLCLCGMIVASREAGAFQTALKAFVIMGASDLCLLAGACLTGFLAGTWEISRIDLTLSGAGAAAFILLALGAIAKAGSMPFHSWIPDAAQAAPLPFMAFFPAAMEKLLGIYLLARLATDLFLVIPGSTASLFLMSAGGVTIILAVMMALAQKEYKRLLSYHAISQVGYMILGIGTAHPLGIIGGIFHMLNNCLYKSGLFLTAGAVERQAGTTDLQKLGGLGKRMPLTFALFAVCAFSISGVPPFNGFFSKEMIYEAALEHGWVFYLIALAGSFFTAASFLKLGHAAFLGKEAGNSSNTREAPALMLLPLALIAAACVIFGFFNPLVVRLLLPALARMPAEAHLGAMPPNLLLPALSLAALAAALLNHIFGVRRGGSALKASDHIRYAPLLKGVYSRAEKGALDPFNIGMAFSRNASRLFWQIDRLVNWFYDTLCVKFAYACAGQVRRWHDGNYSTYILWSLAGATLVVVICILF